MSLDIEVSTEADPLWIRVCQVIERKSLIPTQPASALLTPIVVGVSGGVDSICLLHILGNVRAQLGLELHAAHLNHGLRSESAKDAAFVARCASRMRIPFHINTIVEGQLQISGSSIENRARDARYRFLTRVAQEVSGERRKPIIAVAHHADDQAETVLINLIRGSGLRGLSGMDWQLDREETTIIRPLLSTSKHELAEYAQRHGLAWVEDITNEDQTILRNHIRHQVLPILGQVNPNISQTLARTAQILKDEYKRAISTDSKTLNEILIPGQNLKTQPERKSVSSHEQEPSSRMERCVLNHRALCQLDQATRRNILRLALDSITADHLNNITFEMIDDLAAAIENPVTPGISHPIAQTTAWTVGYLQRPELLTGSHTGYMLSLHHASALPFIPDHPLLDRAWQNKYERRLIETWVPAPAAWRLQVSKLAASELPHNWKQRKNSWEAYIDAKQIQKLWLTTPIQGQRMAPIGMKGKHQSIGNIFTNHKILQPFREFWPIILSTTTEKRTPSSDVKGVVEPEINEEVVWLCGLQLAESVAITQHTTEVIHLKWVHYQEQECERTLSH